MPMQNSENSVCISSSHNRKKKKPLAVLKDLLLPVVDLKVIDPLSLCSPSGQTRIQFIKHFDFRADSKQKKI